MKDKFFKNLEAVAEQTVTEAQCLWLIEKADEIFKSYEDEIAELKSDINDLENSKRDLENSKRNLEEEMSELQDECDKLENFRTYELTGVHQNIVTAGVIDHLFDNLDYIPMDKLQEFLNQYPTL